MKQFRILAMAVLAPGSTLAADFAGSWRIDNLFNGATATVSCMIVQTGDALSGSCRPEIPGMQATDLTGTVHGSSAQWGYDLVFNGNPARVDYQVELTADGTLTGSLLRNGSPSPITGSRQ